MVRLGRYFKSPRQRAGEPGVSCTRAASDSTKQPEAAEGLAVEGDSAMMCGRPLYREDRNGHNPRPRTGGRVKRPSPAVRELPQKCWPSIPCGCDSAPLPRFSREMSGSEVCSPAARDCGVSLPDSALSSEELYD
jgi:hypothetical protein